MLWDETFPTQLKGKDCNNIHNNEDFRLHFFSSRNRDLEEQAPLYITVTKIIVADPEGATHALGARRKGEP